MSASAPQGISAACSTAPTAAASESGAKLSSLVLRLVIVIITVLLIVGFLFVVAIVFNDEVQMSLLRLLPSLPLLLHPH